MPFIRRCSTPSRVPVPRSPSRPTSIGPVASARSSRSPWRSRRAAGRPVKLLLDAIGSSSIGPEILDVLETGGCQIAWYNPIRWYTLGRFNNRTHRKSLIIDGRVAFTGGAGIADHWRGNARGPDEWRDLQVRIEGPAVVPLQTGFAHNWQQTTGELLSGDAYYPTIEPSGRLAVQTILSSPETGASSVRTMYYLSIACARESIDIANPYFVPDPVAIEMLIEAKQRGVDVRIMVSGIRNDNWVARHNSVRLFGRLLAANIEIQEFNRTMLHQKTMVVDRRWVTVGTTNFDNRSFAHNEESNVCCFDERPSRAAAADVRRRSQRVRARDRRTLENTRRVGTRSGVRRRRSCRSKRDDIPRDCGQSRAPDTACATQTACGSTSRSPRSCERSWWSPSPGSGGNCGSGCWCSCWRHSWRWRSTRSCSGSRRTESVADMARRWSCCRSSSRSRVSSLCQARRWRRTRVNSAVGSPSSATRR